MPKIKRIYIYRDSHLPEEGWLQSCFKCKEITGKYFLFQTFHKDDDQKKPDFYKFADYMCDLTLHGFRELYGTDVIDYPGSWQLYKDEALKRKLDKNIIFGKGFTYTNILNDFDKIDRMYFKILGM